MPGGAAIMKAPFHPAAQVRGGMTTSQNTSWAQRIHKENQSLKLTEKDSNFYPLHRSEDPKFANIKWLDPSKAPKIKPRGASTHDTSETVMGVSPGARLNAVSTPETKFWSKIGRKSQNEDIVEPRHGFSRNHHGGIFGDVEFSKHTSFNRKDPTIRGRGIDQNGSVTAQVQRNMKSRNTSRPPSTRPGSATPQFQPRPVSAFKAKPRQVTTGYPDAGIPRISTPNRSNIRGASSRSSNRSRR